MYWLEYNQLSRSNFTSLDVFWTQQLVVTIKYNNKKIMYWLEYNQLSRSNFTSLDVLWTQQLVVIFFYLANSKWPP